MNAALTVPTLATFTKSMVTNAVVSDSYVKFAAVHGRKNADHAIKLLAYYANGATLITGLTEGQTYRVGDTTGGDKFKLCLQTDTATTCAVLVISGGAAGNLFVFNTGAAVTNAAIATDRVTLSAANLGTVADGVFVTYQANGVVGIPEQDDGHTYKVIDTQSNSNFGLSLMAGTAAKIALTGTATGHLFTLGAKPTGGGVHKHEVETTDAVATWRRISPTGNRPYPS